MDVEALLTLSKYNAEVARGIMHTPQWNNLMATMQELYDLEHPELKQSSPKANQGGC